MEDITETIYKIRHQASGRYSNGGRSPGFTKNGKTWHNLGALKQHLNLVPKNHPAYRECELVVLTRQVLQAEKVLPLDDFIEGLSVVQRKHREEERQRRETREKAERRKMWEQLNKEFASE